MPHPANEIVANTQWMVSSNQVCLKVTPGSKAGKVRLQVKDGNGNQIHTGDIVSTKMRLIPDYNRDRKIDSSDQIQATVSNPFRFWINDDDDDGDISDGDDDEPGRPGGLLGAADYDDNDVDGRSDLLDFFPVWLDIKLTLDLLPPAANIEYRLRHNDEAFRFVYTDLTKEHAGQFLTTESANYNVFDNIVMDGGLQ